MVCAVFLDLAQRHCLDQSEVVPFATAPAQHLRDLVLVQAGQRDHVDLHRQSRLARGGDPAQHRGKISSARYVRKTLRAQTVQTHVDPPHPRVVQSACEVFEPCAVGGHRELIQAGADPRADRRCKFNHPAPHQRLASSEPNLAHSAADEDVGELDDLLQREDLTPGKELHPLCHAVSAAQIAPIRD